MKPLRSLLLSLTLTILLAACAGATLDREASTSFEAAPVEPFVAESGEAFAGAESAADTAVAFQQVQVQERLIIRDGRMDVVVEDTEEALAEVARLAESSGGWVVSSELYGADEAKSGTITVRIPADEFDATVEHITDLAVEVRSQSTNSQDVTEEYIDLSARLDNLEATAERVRRFLDQARNVEEALEVNRELSRLESEIESLKGRVQFLERSAAFSSLTVSLTPDELSQPIEVAGWRPEGVARDAVETLISALQGLGTLAIWGLTFCLPLGLLAGIPLYLLYRFGYRRWRARRSTRARESEPETAGE